MPNCPSCNQPMWSISGGQLTSTRYACVNAMCSPEKTPATLDNVLAEFRAIRALMKLAEVGELSVGGTE